MGKFKNFLIQCIDNQQEPLYSLRKLQSYKRKKDEKHEESKESKEKKPVRKGTLDKPFV